MQLNIVKGNLNEAIKSKEFLTYYPHRIGHWLGMDVHDVGDYFEADGMSRRLEPGMVMTIEPGLYFSRNDKTVPPAYRGIGIRIEDNILITKSSNRVLTNGIPKEITEIESLMRG
jgi:Xaa-Pro aminopeptidase